MKRLLSNTIDKINRKKVYESTFESILKDWQEKDAMPENASKCVQRYIIENKDKDKFYAAFKQAMIDALAEKNITDIDRLIQVFTQAKNQEVNSKAIKIVEQVIQRDLTNGSKSKIKNDPELAKNLLEIIKSNFADCFVDQEKTKKNNQNSEESKEPLIVKETKNKTDKSKDSSADDIFAYQTIITLLSSQSNNCNNTNTKEEEKVPLSSNSDKPGNNCTEDKFTIEEVKLIGGSSSTYNTSPVEKQED